MNQPNAHPDNTPDEVIGSVTNVVADANKPYAVTKTKSHEGSVTFSLEVWQGKSPPQLGQEVLLSDVIRTGRGLRANSARPSL